MTELEFMTTNNAQVAIDDTAINELKSKLRGSLILPDDDDYNETRQVWNGMIDKHPAAIVQCAGTADVIHAVNFGRENNLLVSVRGGGHNVAGNAVCDSGLVIDLTGMNSVYVDAANQTVRAEGGTTIGDLDQETQVFGLAVPQGAVSETGIAGLTLGGGMGHLRRKYGLSCDNLISVDVVTASGKLVRANETENPDLFWGIRGGGGNFGIVTSFEFRAYPVGPDVYFAVLFHPWGNAKAALQFYREWALNAPDEISSLCILCHIPAIEDIPSELHHKPSVLFLAMHSGNASAGEKALQSLVDFGEPVVDFSSVTPYLQAQKFFDEDYPSGELRYYWKSQYLSVLSDEAIDILVKLNEESPSHHSTIDIWQMGGALSRIGAEETAFGDRSAAFLLGTESNWEDATDDDANIAWNRKVYREMQPFSTGGEYLNFPGFYEDGDRMVKNTFGANYARLVELKNKYDPTNYFQMNQNIKPSV